MSNVVLAAPGGLSVDSPADACVALGALAIASILAWVIYRRAARRDGR